MENRDDTRDAAHGYSEGLYWIQTRIKKVVTSIIATNLSSDDEISHTQSWTD